ncbi:MAG TPA: Hpt domain-containing protein [Thermoanaerobaculia bacterium]|nr:Hpt domain-containing protein [Thermoanaerobaculia bacterium]
MDYELNELRREFLDEARGKVEEMQATLDGENRSPDTLERLAYLAHQLKGSGGSYGYQSISADAAQLEKAIESGNGNDPGLIRYVQSLRIEIDRAVQELG